MFQTVAIPFDAFQQLPSPAHRWLLTCLTRYTDKAGRCWPTLRQLVADARMSLATVSRRMTEMHQLGVFQRERRGRGRYVYTVTEAYRPRWPQEKPRPRANGRDGTGAYGGDYNRVSPMGQRVPQDERHKKYPNKQDVNSHGEGLPDERSKWEARLRSWRKSRFWLPFWGPKPSEPGCFAPAALLTAQLCQGGGQA